MSAPNDIVFDRQGGFYFTDLGKRRARDRDHGSLYYALPDGSKIVELVHPMLSPNGVGLSPDGSSLSGTVCSNFVHSDHYPRDRPTGL